MESGATLTDTARALLHQAGVQATVTAVEPLSGGANNRAFRVRSSERSYLLKEYWREPGERDRLGAEFEFARFAREGGLEVVPAALARAEGAALYEFVEGRPAVPGDVTVASVGQAAELAAGLIRLGRAGGERLPEAAEACFSLAGHLDLIGGRVERLARIDPAQEMGEECLRLVHGRLMPAWDLARERMEAKASENGPDLRAELPRDGRCVSPSDFGFHNALVEAGGRLRFVDFEYAGWDDPAKLVCDFFCQPAVPVAHSHLPAFAERVLVELADPEAARTRVGLLLPCYRVKWVCIMLNEFLPAGSRRRAFARGADPGDARRRQLGRARAALDAIEAATKPG